jgi:hypothetical protein
LPSGAKTLHKSFVISAEKYGDCMLFGTRQIVGNDLGDCAWKNYSEIRDFSKKNRLRFTVLRWQKNTKTKRAL